MNWRRLHRNIYKNWKVKIKMIRKKIILALLLFVAITTAFAVNASALQYIDDNQANVSFDISMPIDSTGYTLRGKNLTGGHTQFTDQGIFVAPFLAHETGKL